MTTIETITGSAEFVNEITGAVVRIGGTTTQKAAAWLNPVTGARIRPATEAEYAAYIQGDGFDWNGDTINPEQYGFSRPARLALISTDEAKSLGW